MEKTLNSNLLLTKDLFLSLSLGVKQHLIDLFSNITDCDDSGRTKQALKECSLLADHGPHSWSLTAAPVWLQSSLRLLP